MKVLQINASYKPAYIYGGPTLSVSGLCEGLVNAGNDIKVLTTTANGLAELGVNPGSPVVVDGVDVTYFKRFTKDHTHFSPGLLRYLWQKLKANDSKALNTSIIIHIHAWWNLVSVFSCWIAKKHKRPVVLSPRGTLSRYSFNNRHGGIKGFIHKLIGKKLLEYSHFHVTSDKEKEDILRLIKPKSITVIPNFVHLPSLDEVKRFDKPIDDIFRLLFLSRIEEKKGLDILLHALHLIESSTNAEDGSKQLSLTIAGSGDSEYINKLKNIISMFNLQTSIQWLGQVNQKEKWRVMAEHDLLILPSRDENFANVIVESLAMGTPVLISKQVGLADYVQQQQFGWICDNNADSVSVMLLDAIADKLNRKVIRQIAPERIRHHFDEKNLVRQYEKMYEGILKSKAQ